MYLLYLDESGDVANWRQQSNFVIAGIGVYEFRLKALSARIKDVQAKYFPEIPVPIVFHATDIHAATKEQLDSITRNSQHNGKPKK